MPWYGHWIPSLPTVFPMDNGRQSVPARVRQSHGLAVLGAVQRQRAVSDPAGHRFAGHFEVPGGDVPGIQWMAEDFVGGGIAGLKHSHL